MTIDTTKITPEKLAEMNASLMVDNNYLRGRIKELDGNKTKLRDSLRRCLNEAEDWLDTAVGCTPDKLLDYDGWADDARAILELTK